MPDTKAEDEVDFLNKTRAPPAQEVVGNGTTTPKMKQGPGTQAVSGICRPLWTERCTLVCLLIRSLGFSDRLGDIRGFYPFLLVLLLKRRVVFVQLVLVSSKL